MRSPLHGGLAAAALVLGLCRRRIDRRRRQTDPRLVSAVRAAQEGRGDSARAAVDRLLAATPPTDTLYPQILYTQAMVAGTAGRHAPPAPAGDGRVRHLELGGRRAAPAGADGLRHPELRRRRPQPRAAQARLPGHPAAAAGRVLGRAHLFRRQQPVRRLPLAGRRHGADRRTTSSSRTSSATSTSAATSAPTPRRRPAPATAPGRLDTGAAPAARAPVDTAAATAPRRRPPAANRPPAAPPPRRTPSAPTAPPPPLPRARSIACRSPPSARGRRPKTRPARRGRWDSQW